MLDDYEKQVVELWNLGKSASEIGKILGKTRNSIVGKIWRIRQRGFDISNRESRKKKVKAERKPRPKKEKVIKTVFVGNVEKTVVEFKPQKAESANPLNIKFNKLKKDSCRYVMNDGLPENFIFCGAPIGRGSYCEAHASICYTVSERREKPKFFGWRRKVA